MDRIQRAARREDRIAALLLVLGAAFERPRASRAWLAAVPVILVNYVAFRAQLRFWQAWLSPADAVLVSVALESIAVYWAWMAHQAMVADDSALRPRLAAYGMALLIGVLNYSHYMRPGWKPTVAAVTFGMMSVISPWLWTAYSRRISRPVLKAKQLIEDHAVRLGITRWAWHAYRCVRVMHWATWTGENKPAEAIRAVYPPDQPAQSAAPQTPPPDSGTREPEDQHSEAWETGLAAARTETEREMIRELVLSGKKLPAEREFARTHPELAERPEATGRRAAKRVLAGAQMILDGKVNGRDTGSP